MPMSLHIACDGCGRDLTTTANAVDYRLCLRAERILPAETVSGTTLGLALRQPPIEQDAYFCGVACLAKWVEARKATA